MWTCESNSKIGTPESRLIETVEPLWKPAQRHGSKTFTSARLQRLHTHLHQRIKDALKSPISWWKVAPLFALPLSIYNVRQLLLVCSRLLQSKHHNWISQKFSVKYAPALCVLACVNGNRVAAQKYLKYIPVDVYPKVLNVLCGITAPTTAEVQEIAQHIVQSISRKTYQLTCHHFLTDCLKNDGGLFHMVVSCLEISTFDWRSALQLVGETWSEEQRKEGMGKFLHAVQFQSQKSDNFLYALDREMVGLKYQYTSLPVGWKEIVQNSDPIMESCKKKYLLCENHRCDAISTLKNTQNLAVVEGVLRFIQSSVSDSEILRILIENDLCVAAELFVKMYGTTDISEKNYVTNPIYPHLCSISLKDKLAQNIPTHAFSRNRKL